VPSRSLNDMAQTSQIGKYVIAKNRELAVCCTLVYRATLPRCYHVDVLAYGTGTSVVSIHMRKRKIDRRSGTIAAQRRGAQRRAKVTATALYRLEVGIGVNVRSSGKSFVYQTL
jgi:hypothetical protein